MGLDIYSSDDTKNFHIGYIGFSTMRSFFILHYSKKLFEDYNTILCATIKWDEKADVIFDKLLEEIGDLSILINHSDCDGELSSDECKKLRKCLVVDEEKIKSLSTVQNYENMINTMYEFIDLIDYCAEHDDMGFYLGSISASTV